jgi:molecular chaperone GrpE
MSLWPDDEKTLAQFREWLEEARASADALVDDEAEAEVRTVGLFQVVEEFTALRQELKLQTKGARALEEQTQAALAALQRASEQFQSVSAKEADAARRAAGPLIEAIIDLDDALRRGRQAIETACRRLQDESAHDLRELLQDRFHRQPRWWRILSGRWHSAMSELFLRETAEMHRSVFGSLLEGYDLIQNRLHRAMQQEQIFRMECVGQPVDPQCMTVVEVIDDPSRPPGLVVAEVRSGYYWKSKVFRYAEVKAVAMRVS